MFFRKMSRNNRKESPNKTSSQHLFAKRSSLMCLSEKYSALCISPIPPPRYKLWRNKHSTSFESILTEIDRKSALNPDEQKKVKEWSESFNKLLDDRNGVTTFLRYLETEHSAENIRFWISCERYKRASCDELRVMARELYEEYLCGDGANQINIDSYRVKEIEHELDTPNRWTFQNVQWDIFLLMKRDSYPRFLKSNIYGELLDNSSGPLTVT